MAAHAIIPTNEVDSFLLNNPLIRKPKSGVSMIAIQAMPMPDCENDIVWDRWFIFIWGTKFLFTTYKYLYYHFNRLRILMSTLFTLRYIKTKIDKPTATSAAATAIIKKTITCPPASLCITLNAAKSRFTAFSISSIHIRIMMALRLISTPITPIQNKMPDSIR